MTDNPLLLREVAKKIKATRRHRNSQSAGKLELLTFLRTEKIKASVDFPSHEQPSFNVPAKYWKDVKSGDFQNAISRQPAKGNKGDYLMRAKLFVDQYVTWLLQNHGPSDKIDELTAAFRAFDKKVEVFVLESEWSRFVSDEGLDTTEIINEQKRSKAGAPEHEKWAPLLVQIAALLITEDTKQGRQVAAEKIAARAMERVEEDLGKGDMPKADTVAGKVRDIRHEVSRLKKPT